jgi:uncharacterized heparinase superfamily protein
MPTQVLKHIQKTASQFAYKSVIYNWSLRGQAPERLVVKPVDPWPGSAEAARWLYNNGAFKINDDRLELFGECWEPKGVNQIWLEHMHGFTWLRDLRAMGGESARQFARAMIESWISHYRNWKDMPWRLDVTGERVAMWISLYEFFSASVDEDFHDVYFDVLVRQARHLSRSLPGDMSGVGLLKGIKGLLYAGLAFEGYEHWVEQSLDMLKKELAHQILGDGAHISRCPTQLLSALQVTIDIRTALVSGGYPLPDYVQHAIDRMGQALRFFRYNDKHFGLFNGTQKGNQGLVDCVLGQAGVRGKALQGLPCAGYERMTLGRTLVMFDGGASPEWPHDQHAHAAPLAFEMCHGRDRIFVSCGSHPTDESWKDALRATAAHNTVTLDYRNACEIRDDGHFQRKVKKAHIQRECTKDACLVESFHDGYVPLNGIVHGRRLYLGDGGYDFRGEDTLTSAIGVCSRPVDVAIRFHVHPRVLVSLVQGGEEALLRLPSGIGWRFTHNGAALALEDSVYLGEGTRPRKTKQLVIYGQVAEEQLKIKWRVSREG